MVNFSSSNDPHEKKVLFLLKLQASFPVSRWKVSGVDLWPILRVSLGREIVAFHRFSSKTSVFRLPQFILLTRQLTALLWHTLPGLPRAETSASAVLFEPRPRAKTLEPIRNSLEERGLQTYDLTGAPRTRPTLRELAVAFWQARETHVPLFGEVKRASKDYLGFHPPSLTRSGLFLRLLEMRLAMNRFEAVLSSLRADYLFTVRSLVDSLALVATGRHLGVTTVLVQGGFMDSDNNHLTAQWGRPNSDSLPDIYWAWTQELADWVRHNNVAGTVLSGGNTVFIHAYRTSQSIDISGNGKTTRSSGQLPKLVVLVLLQPGVDLPLKWLDQIDSCEVILRLHPGQKKFPNAICSWSRASKHSVNFQKSREITLVDSLSKVDFVFTGPSASIMECVAFGIPVLIPTSFRGQMLAYLDHGGGLVHYCKTGDQLKKKALTLSKKPEHGEGPSSDFFLRQVSDMEVALNTILLEE